ncbi:MAG TPA: hypothetical protein VEQ65_12950, partial [Opitutus sp.]|nr:hypothetical protein [Opitutus sp.]
MKLPAYKILHVFVFGFLLMLGTAFGAEEPPAPSPAQDTSLREGPEPNSPEGETGKLRRLDTAPLEDADPSADEAPDAPAPDAAPEPEDAQPERAEQHSRHSHHHGSERVAFWHDATLAEGEFADAVVSIFGSSTSAGEVGDAMVSIFGSSTSTGRVGDAVVSVMGRSRVSGGRVGDVVASIFGNTYVNTEVGDVVVAVLGNVELGPRAIVHGEVVCIGGTVKRHPDAVVHGQVNNVSFGANFGGFEWLHAWISRCLLLGRPLAFDARVMWAWWIALAFVGFYALLALLFPRGVQRCAETLETRPGYSILAAFLVALGTPLAALVLLPTVVGTPALIVTLFLIGLFGKAVFLAWIGRRLTRTSTRPEGVAPALAVLLGGAVLLLLYTVPVLGFIVAKLTSWLGLGVVFYTMMQSNKRPKLAPAAAVSPAAAAPVSTPLGATGGSA